MAIRLVDFGTDFRPSRFSDLINPGPSIANLAAMLARGEAPRTALFSGPFGCGKTTSAYILARHLLCKSPVAGTGDPCGVCPACTTPMTANTDFQYYNSRNLVVADVKELLDSVKYRPRISSNRVTIFDEAHALSTACQSLLLTPVETPPAPHIVWLFSTNQQAGLRPELISRALPVRVTLPTKDDIVELLRRVAAQALPSVPGDDILSAVAVATGCHYRDALHLLQAGSVSGSLTTESEVEALASQLPSRISMNLLSSIIAGDAQGALSISATTEEPRTVIKLLTELASKLAVYTISGRGLQPWEVQDITKIPGTTPRAIWTTALLQFLPDSEALCNQLQTFSVPESVALNNFTIRWALRFRDAIASATAPCA